MRDPAPREPLERRLVAGRRRDPRPGPVEREVGRHDPAGSSASRRADHRASDRSAPSASSCVARPPSRTMRSAASSAARNVMDIHPADRATPRARSGCARRSSGPRRRCGALPADADRGRVARAAGLRPDPPQPRGELGHGCDARATSGSTSAGSCSSTATTSACPSCGRRSPPTGRASTRTTCSSRPAPSRRLFLVHTTLLEAGSHAVVARPNYATNVETPRAIGADVSFLDLAYEDGWAVDPDRIAALLRPETRLVSLTTPHNPTGATLDRATLDAVIALRRAARHGAPAGRRDVPRDDVRRAAAGRGDALRPR